MRAVCNHSQLSSLFFLSLFELLGSIKIHSQERKLREKEKPSNITLLKTLGLTPGLDGARDCPSVEMQRSRTHLSQVLLSGSWPWCKSQCMLRQSSNSGTPSIPLGVGRKIKDQCEKPQQYHLSINLPTCLSIACLDIHRVGPTLLHQSSPDQTSCSHFLLSVFSTCSMIVLEETISNNRQTGQQTKETTPSMQQAISLGCIPVTK